LEISASVGFMVKKAFRLFIYSLLLREGNFGLSLLFQNGATVPHLRKID
jgi:hypothetical protein